MHAVRALDGAGGAIAATHAADLFGKPQEVLAPQGELAVKVGVGQVADGVGDGQALGALRRCTRSRCGSSRADLFVQRRQQLLIVRCKRLRHGPEVLLQLVHVGHARNGGGESGFCEDPFERRECRPGGMAGGACCPRGFAAAAITFIPTSPMPALVSLLGGVVRVPIGEVVGAEHHLELADLENAVHDGVRIVRAHADEADLALLLGRRPGVDDSSVICSARVSGVHVPDVEVIRAEFLQTGLELRRRFGRGGASDLLDRTILSRPALQGGADHAFVVAALIAARGIEVGDAHVQGPRNHTGIGRDHAAEAHGGDLQSRLAQRTVIQCRSRRGRGHTGSREAAAGRASPVARNLLRDESVFMLFLLYLEPAYANSSCARIRRSVTCTPFGHWMGQVEQSLQRTLRTSSGSCWKCSRPRANWP